MTKAISVKLDDAIFEAASQHVGRLKTNRNAYINQAIRFFNRLQDRRLLRAQLRHESALVRDANREVLRDFEPFQDEGL